MSHITREQRYTIERLLTNGATRQSIAEIIGKDKAVVSREISRNKDQRNGTYKADLAQRKCEMRHKHKPKQVRLTEEVKAVICDYLRADYSPEQIVGHCKSESIVCVSHECIYQYVWKDKKQGGDLHTHLRRQGRKYRKRGNEKDSRGIIRERVDIDQRPAIVDKKARFGDLEVDTIVGKNHQGAIVTINDRASGYLWMRKVANRTSEEVSKAVISLLNEEKDYLKTMTADNGKEFAGHQSIAQALMLYFYFAKPYHSWERGANENLNGLVRQYIPKGTCLSSINDQFIAEVQNKINSRPRKRFNYKTPEFVKKQLLITEKVAFMT